MTAAKGLDLASLVAPMDAERFFATHWERSSVHLRGHAEKLDALAFNSEELFRLAAQQRRGRWEAAVKAAFLDPQGDHREVPIDGDTARLMFAAGMSICFSYMDTQHAGLGAMCERLRVESGYDAPIRANGYLSGNDRGFGLHFDDHSVMVLQLEGSKRWRYGTGPAVPFPSTNFITTSGQRRMAARLAELGVGAPLRIPARSELTESELRPGDVLYLPAGTWHETEACGQSLSITLMWTRRPVIDDVVAAIQERAKREPAWRAARFPAIARRGPTVAPGSAAYRRERIREVRDFLDRLLAEDDASEPAASPSRPLGDDDRVRQNDRAPLFLVDRPTTGGGRAAFLYSGELEVEIDPAWERVFARLAQGEVLTVREIARSTEATTPADRERVLASLEELVDASALRRA